MNTAARLAAVALLLASCQSAPAPIASDAPAEIWFQRAQSASDLGNYDEALKLYRDYLALHTEGDHEAVFSARYEVALLLEKKGLNDQALKDFESIVADYDNLEKSSGAPAWVKVLSAKKAQELRAKAVTKK